jgi:hypothetical protein
LYFLIFLVSLLESIPAAGLNRVVDDDIIVWINRKRRVYQNSPDSSLGGLDSENGLRMRSAKKAF